MVAMEAETVLATSKVGLNVFIYTDLSNQLSYSNLPMNKGGNRYRLSKTYTRLNDRYHLFCLVFRDNNKVMCSCPLLRTLAMEHEMFVTKKVDPMDLNAVSRLSVVAVLQNATTKARVVANKWLVTPLLALLKSSNSNDTI